MVKIKLTSYLASFGYTQEDIDWMVKHEGLRLCNGGWEEVNQKGWNLYGKNGQPGYGGENLIRGEELKKKLIEEGRWEEVKEKISLSLKNKISENGSWWTGRQHSEETKKKISQKTKVHQTGSGNSQFGTMWITNGVENKKVKKDSIIPVGYSKGRKC